VAGGSEIAGERLRRAAFGPKIPPSGEAKLPPISGQKSSLRTVNLRGFLEKFGGHSSVLDGGMAAPPMICKRAVRHRWTTWWDVALISLGYPGYPV
jgi:hypothetical protein